MKFFADEHLREVSLNAFSALLLKVVGAGFAFSFNLVVARLLGAEGAGVYFLALSITTISSVVARVGLDNAVLKFIATNAVHKEWGKVRGVYTLGICVVIPIAGLLSTIGFISSSWIANEIFSKPSLGDPLKWMLLSILPLSLLNLNSESLKGIKRIPEAMIVQSVALPFCTLLLIFPLSRWFGVQGVSISYLLGTTVVALLGFCIWRKRMSQFKAPTENFSKKKLWVSCKPLFLASLMNRGLMPWAPLLLLGLWVTNEDVGVFGAATRVSMLISMMLVTVNSIMAPKFAELYAKGEVDVLARTFKKSARLVVILVTPIFVTLFILGESVMSLFGEEFISGSSVLRILLVGQFVNVLCGSVGYLLMMSGNEEIYKSITILSGLLQLFLVVVLSPMFGVAGAAWSMTIALSCMNFLGLFFVYKKIGIKIYNVQ